MGNVILKLLNLGCRYQRSQSVHDNFDAREVQLRCLVELCLKAGQVLLFGWAGCVGKTGKEIEAESFVVLLCIFSTDAVLVKEAAGLLAVSGGGEMPGLPLVVDQSSPVHHVVL